MRTNAKRNFTQARDPGQPYIKPKQDSRSEAALRVLVVDDYRDAADSTALFLNAAGVETEVAYDGSEAFDRMKTWTPHACVLDLAMPLMNGFELAHHARAMAGPRLLLIAVTGWVHPANESGAFAAGFNCFMRKPVSPEGLLRVIQGQLLMWCDPAH